MGKRGPRKKLSKLEIMEGKPGKRAVVDLGVEGLGEIFVPDHLPDDAVGCIEVVKISMPPGVYSRLDSFLLSAFAMAWSEHKHATHIIAAPDFKRVIHNSVGNLVVNPWLKHLNQQAVILASLGDRLGLDPKARQNLRLPAEAPKSKFGGLIARPGSSASLNS
jgi:phage terminase small subunit